MPVVARAHLLNETAKAIDAELPAVGIDGFEDAIGVSHQHVARVKGGRRCFLLELVCIQYAKQWGAGCEFFQTAVGASEEGGWMAAVRPAAE